MQSIGRLTGLNTGVQSWQKKRCSKEKHLGPPPFICQTIESRERNFPRESRAGGRVGTKSAGLASKKSTVPPGKRFFTHTLLTAELAGISWPLSVFSIEL